MSKYDGNFATVARIVRARSQAVFRAIPPGFGAYRRQLNFTPESLQGAASSGDACGTFASAIRSGKFPEARLLNGESTLQSAEDFD